MLRYIKGLMVSASMLLVSNAYADVGQITIGIGVSVSETGPAASMGIPQKNTALMAYKEIDGIPVKVIIYDDKGDSATSVKNMRKMVTENRIDALIGSTISAPTLAMTEVAGETQTPIISLNHNKVVVAPQKGAKKWVFKAAQNDDQLASAVKKGMLNLGVKTLGLIGFSDTYGQAWFNQMHAALKDGSIKIVSEQVFARNDTSVTGQILKIISKKPDAVLVATSGTPGALPTRELRRLGYKGKIFHTYGSANYEVLKICSDACNGVILPVGPVVVASQLPDEHPSKSISLKYQKAYEDIHGPNTMNAFGAHMYDALILFEEAVRKTLKTGLKPGTQKFRVALRDALENNQNIVGTQGVYNVSSSDHSGLDDRAVVLIEIVNGKWVYRPDLLK